MRLKVCSDCCEFAQRSGTLSLLNAFTVLSVMQLAISERSVQGRHHIQSVQIACTYWACFGIHTRRLTRTPLPYL
ncbi:hypothetical protein AWB96_11235 [Mycobacteroides chelonae]|nr:hypothetical protein GR01_08850 [Mycobacteroides chelonae]ANB00891.1 hypothetical protein BB28_09355 [Mycobacteroides chelonae CCUG 47445]OLT78133.1 hypothetical protein BKG56_14270 [Mycobacteroides chelonae]ORV15077.1 hypothetical protein AWB96_11235 [Mycobacteroides chelonae]